MSDIIATITQGRQNLMPAHADKLTPAQIHVLSAYVLSLGGNR
jgi:mono/diheme cytochrome c family protein